MSAVFVAEARALVDGVDALIDDHGIESAEAMAVLRLAQAHARRASAFDQAEMVKEQLSGPDGLEGTRAKRSLREYYRDAPWLRLVVDNTEPRPSGPAARKAA